MGIFQVAPRMVPNQAMFHACFMCSYQVLRISYIVHIHWGFRYMRWVCVRGLLVGPFVHTLSKKNYIHGPRPSPVPWIRSRGVSQTPNKITNHAAVTLTGKRKIDRLVHPPQLVHPEGSASAFQSGAWVPVFRSDLSCWICCFVIFILFFPNSCLTRSIPE